MLLIRVGVRIARHVSVVGRAVAAVVIMWIILHHGGVHCDEMVILRIREDLRRKKETKREEATPVGNFTEEVKGNE